jgi:hypothetical protein
MESSDDSYDCLCVATAKSLIYNDISYKLKVEKASDRHAERSSNRAVAHSPTPVPKSRIPVSSITPRLDEQEYQFGLPKIGGP